MGKKSFMRFTVNTLKQAIFLVALSVILAWMIRIMVAQPYHIPTGSMFPTIKPGDFVLASPLPYKMEQPERGDVMVFKLPTKKVPYIKRVIGLPGDKITVKDGKVLVNERPLKIKEARRPSYTLKPLRVPRGHLFVLGDNRNNSWDSHYWGFLSEKDVMSQALLVYWPPRHWRKLF